MVPDPSQPPYVCADEWEAAGWGDYVVMGRQTGEEREFSMTSVVFM